MSKYNKYKENFKKSIQESNNRPDKYELEDCELMPEDDTEYVKNYLNKKKGGKINETDV
jgi:hypothetical protein